MKRKNRKKLIFQLVLVICVLFMLLNASVIAMMYQSAVNGFMESQKVTSETILNNATDCVFLFSSHPDTRTYCITEWEKDIKKVQKEFPYEDNGQNELDYATEENPYGSLGWLKSLPDDMMDYELWVYYDMFCGNFDYEFDRAPGYSQIFCIELCEPYTGMVVYDSNMNTEKSKVGSYYDISKSKAIQKLLNSGSAEIEYERIKDFPEEGSYFMGYKTVFLEGKPKFIVGLSYQWDAIRQNQLRNILTVTILSVVVFTAILLVLSMIIRRIAVKPISQMNAALKEYLAENDPAKVVKHMYDIKVQNEIGYLADIMSDFVLEIDASNKENIRIATERERAEKELYQAEVQIMVSQIQPHFMYNALTSIAMMCKIDPDTAYQATINFAKYLRGNMDSLKQTKPVPFRQELEHLKKYVYIEQLRFGEKLKVVYEIGPTDFFLPQLSIQPLVENAVKHGVGMKKEGGTVTISTRETETAYEVIISDDGVGFHTEAPKPKDDKHSHVGMENTKNRLQEMCGGTIQTESTVGVGTTVTVILPKDRQSHDEKDVTG